ncbi:TonB-dependent receptor [Pseudoxanthomonas sp. SL93]|uniref:TonB-dependent receptor n=1 Tax=Pseudoxanthomonas sp. SL93 TaxID=2995142 RepID=UPI00226E7873|nr:TonB-dependent receptor [Pseudoxanthomonas sp. SL93]WAC64184.1 TonB-dependent receptor [Pseudoxanthomonas sp. SL93]
MLKKSTMALAVMGALYASTAFAQDSASPDAGAAGADASAQTLDTVSVIGLGETRQVQRLSPERIRALPPGTSPLKLLADLPGVNFQSADAFGAYEWSARISLRGFNQNQLGFTLDGIPLGDMSYGNNNGLHISRALISENLAGAELAEGIGGVNTASTSNLGGTIQFFSADPLPAFGVQLSQTVGSDATRRTYARLDTGDHQGFAMYLSGMTSRMDKWKGDGEQKQDQVNLKAVYDVGDHRISLLATTSKRDENDYQDLSLDSRRRLGWDWDNYRPDWQRAVDAANGIFTGGVNNLDDAYYDARGLRDDGVLGLSGDFGLAQDVRLHATVYHHTNRGQGHWFTPYVPSSATVPISLRTTEYGIDRTGVMAGLDWTLGNHRIEGGLWLEDNGHTVQRNYYFINGPIDDSFFLRGPDIRQFYQRFDVKTRQFYLKDTIRLLDDRLSVDIGFKSPRVEIESRIPAGTFVSRYAEGDLTAKDSFLPQLGASYRLSGNNEIFASYAENMAAFQAGITGPFATTQVAFDAFAGQLQPERSETVEAGFRHSGETLQASLALYHVKFENRLLSVAQCSGIQGCPSAFANVGSVTSEGAEATLVWTPIEGLRWYNTLSWNESTYDSNYLNGTTLVEIEGKQTVNTPEEMFSTSLTWTRGPLELSVGANYTGKRYYTYSNDSGVPSFWLANAGGSWSFGEVGPMEDLRLSLHVTNLTDKDYFSTIGTNGFVVSDPAGTYATLLSGAPRQTMLTLSASF